jgi:hypothetical protein
MLERQPQIFMFHRDPRPSRELGLLVVGLGQLVIRQSRANGLKQLDRFFEFGGPAQGLSLKFKALGKAKPFEAL